MAKCIIVSGTRVCDNSPAYRVNGGKVSRPFPILSKSRQKGLQPISRAVRALDVDPAQTKLATALLQVVLAVKWNAAKTANATDIEQSVRLMLVNEIGRLDGQFTLIAY